MLYVPYFHCPVSSILCAMGSLLWCSLKIVNVKLRLLSSCSSFQHSSNVTEHWTYQICIGLRTSCGVCCREVGHWKGMWRNFSSCLTVGAGTTLHSVKHTLPLLLTPRWDPPHSQPMISTAPYLPFTPQTHGWTLDGADLGAKMTNPTCQSVRSALQSTSLFLSSVLSSVSVISKEKAATPQSSLPAVPPVETASRSTVQITAHSPVLPAGYSTIMPAGHSAVTPTDRFTPKP